ncbi:MAG: hypothetical protein Q8L88_04575 [Bacteroidota bacterium]|nr:hypothetical protein [Bacteroidota bacterium]
MMLNRIFFFLISSVYLFAQTSGDQIAFQQAMSASTDSARIAAFDKFIIENPASKLIPNAYAAKFQLYSNLKNDSAAFASIRKYLSLIDQSQVVPALNAVAYEFAQRKFFLDSAAMFIDQAIVLYKKHEPVLLNTQAFVLYQLQRYAEAEKIQQKVIALLPQNSEYDSRYTPFSMQLGFIQVELNEPISGIKKIILGNIILPKQSISVNNIDSLIELKKIAFGRVHAVRDSLYRVVVSEYIKHSPDTTMAKSFLGVSLSRSNVLSETALSFVKESYAAVQTRTIEERSGAAGALGLTYYHLKQYEDAEKYLTEIANYASSNETEIFMSLGDVKEKLGKKKEAFDIYISGVGSSRSTPIYEKLLSLKNELFPTLSLDSIIVVRQNTALQFTPEEFHRERVIQKKNEFSKIVMAELFTGSECRPCQAADIAFDYLIERFKTSSIAILEYHLHIPQPDPLSNADAEKRGDYYGINSTPTAIFGGSTVINSGGNKFAAKSKFILYSEIIERQLKIPSVADISLRSSLKKNILIINAEVLTTVIHKNLKLRIAVVEDEVYYKGSNGIEHHKFVVRKMVKSAYGFSFPKKGKLRVNETLNLKTLTADLAKYYETTNAHYAQLGSGLKAKKNEIDLKRIAVVAFVQDDVTHEILQSSVVKID